MVIFIPYVYEGEHDCTCFLVLDDAVESMSKADELKAATGGPIAVAEMWGQDSGRSEAEKLEGRMLDKSDLEKLS